MSQAKGIFMQGRWNNLPSLVRAPFGRFAEFVLALILGFGKIKRDA